MMRTLGWTMLLAVLALSPVGALPQAQVLDDFAQPAWDGRPNGWTAIGIGASAKLTHLADEGGQMKIEYTFANPQGVLYLVSRKRLRGVPLNLEMTVQGNGKELVGMLLEEALTGQVRELRSSDALDQTGWVTRAVEPQQGGKFQALPDGGGLRLLGLTLRQGPGGSATGTVKLTELVAKCEVGQAQGAMVEIVTGRPEGVFTQGEEPRPELFVTAVAGSRQDVKVSYTVTDGDGSRVGSGNDSVAIEPEQSKRIPVQFTARLGFFKVDAKVEAGGSVRHATARFCVVPEVPAGDGRQFGVDWDPDPANPWRDLLLLQALRRAGVGAVRVVLPWQATERSRGQRSWQTFDQWLALAKQAGMPLFVAVTEPPAWAISSGRTALGAPLAAFVVDAATRAGAQAIGWELLPQPDNPRTWGPEPQPWAYREMAAAVRTALKAKQPQALVINGALQSLTHGFAGALILAPDSPIDGLGVSAISPLRAFPSLEDTRPSAALTKSLADYRSWLKETGRPYVSPWLIDIGVRTSPLEESKAGQAAELTRLAILAAAGGGRLFWHNALDGLEKDDRYGLFRRNLEPKPAVAALATTAAQLYGATFLGSPEGRRDPVFVFNSPAGFVAAGWAESGFGTLSATGEVTAVNGSGNPSGTSVSLRTLPGYLSGKGVAALLAQR